MDATCRAHSKKRDSVKAWRLEWKEELKRECQKRIRRERNNLLQKIRRSGNPTPNFNQSSVTSTLRHILAEELHSFDKCRPSNQQNAITSGSERTISENGTTAENVSSTSTEFGDSVIHNPPEDMLWEYETGQAPKLKVEEEDCLEGLTEDEYQELMMEMERALREDMDQAVKRAEAEMLEDEERISALEKAEFAALVEFKEEMEDENGVLCPFCRQHCVQKSVTTFFCKCGDFSLDTRNDKVDLRYLKYRLGEVFEDHLNLNCPNQPRFLIETQFGVDVLTVRCDTCQMFQLVL